MGHWQLKELGLAPHGARKPQRTGATPGQGELAQPLEGSVLPLQLAAPLSSQLKRPIEAQGDAGHRQGPQQLQGGDAALPLQQLTQAAEQQRCRAAVSRASGQQASGFFKHLLAGPAVEQLQPKAAIPQQRRLQQADQVASTLGIQQPEPRLQAIPCLLGLASPGLQGRQVDGQRQAIELQHQLLGSPSRHAAQGQSSGKATPKAQRAASQGQRRGRLFSRARAAKRRQTPLT